MSPTSPAFPGRRAALTPGACLSRARLRAVLRTLACVLLCACTSLSRAAPDPAAYAPARAPDGAVILQYHFVSQDTPAVTSVTPARFAEHLAWLADHDYRVLSLPDLIARLQRGEALPPRSVAITFDDGYRSVYTTAFPLLEARGWPFTVFVNTAAIDAPGSTFASWSELRRMQAAGATVANHSVSHPYLVRGHEGESEADFEARMAAEVTAAEDRIRTQLGVDHRLFAYPYGEYDDRVRHWLAKHDYVGIGQQSGVVWSGSDFTAVPRFPFSGEYSTMDQFAEKVAMQPLPVIGEADLPSPTLASSDPRPLLRFELPVGVVRSEALACYATGQGRIETRVERSAQAPGRLLVETRASTPLRPGRSRYNCTAPRADGTWTWFSQPWIRLPEDD